MSKTIITHNGQFHCDEVLAYTMLNKLFPDNVLIRTRDIDIITNGDIVIDVGKVYDHSKCRYDHHQESCTETFDGDTILLSSAGLIYRHYGRDYIKLIIGTECEDGLYKDVYNNIIREVDAIDNGLKQAVTNKYYVNTGISRMVGRMNGNDNNDHEIQMIRFHEASNYIELVLEIIIRDLYNKSKSFCNEYDLMCELLDNRGDKNYVVIEFECINWRDCLKKYSETHKSCGVVDFLIYKDNNIWKIRNTFNKHLKDELYVLEHLTNPDDLIFIHKMKFIGSCKSLETAIEIAEMSK